MKLVIVAALGTILLAGCAQDKMASKDKMAMKSGNEAHAHIGHVMTKWADTPKQWGFLPTAMMEAKIAAQHAGFAASKPGDLKYMQTHIKHVVHALNPNVIEKGPGHGYGVVAAASNAAKHIGIAAKSPGATKNIKLHAPHVSTSAKNTATWAKKATNLSLRVLAATSAAQAAPMVMKIKGITEALTAGIDANGDGKVSWEKGEGGLNVANKHMGFMMKGENMTKGAKM